MLFHHLRQIGAEGCRCALRQPEHGMDPEQMALIDLHLLEGLAVLADRAEMLVEPDDERNLLGQLRCQISQILKGFHH